MKRLIAVSTAGLVLALPAGALAGPPAATPEAGPGCFGNWRAGSVQALREDGINAGRVYFSQRKGENSTINAENKAYCETL